MKLLMRTALCAAMLSAGLPAQAALITYTANGSLSSASGDGANPGPYLKAFNAAGGNAFEFRITVDTDAGVTCSSSYCYQSSDFVYSVNGQAWASSSLNGSKARVQVDRSPGGNSGVGILFERLGDLIPAVDGGESFYASAAYLLPVDYFANSALPTDPSFVGNAIYGSSSASLASDADFYPNGGGAGMWGGKAALQVMVGSAVPEPKTWAMMILGFGVIGFARRRRSVLRRV